MISLAINLLGGEKEKHWEDISIERQITVKKFKKKIMSLTRIPPQYQLVSHKNNSLLKLSHPLMGLEKREQLDVKHSEVTKFANYKKNVDAVIAKHPDRKKIALWAVKDHEYLQKVGVFDAYDEYDAFRKEFHWKVARWTDANVGLMKQAAWAFFVNLNNLKTEGQDPNFKCDFTKRPPEYRGRPDNTLATVKMFGCDAPVTYNVKMHHHGPKNEHTFGRGPDICELYAYKLLSEIGIAPKCFIIPPSKTTGTRTSTFIATEWRNDFVIMKDVMADGAVTADLLAQLVLIRVLLFVTDLHLENAGRWGQTDKIAIVDFCPSDKFIEITDIKASVLGVFPHSDLRRNWQEFRRQMSEEEWLRRCKYYFDAWNIASHIEKAFNELDPTKKLLKEMDIIFTNSGESPSNRLEEFKTTLYKNVKNLETVLKRID